ncbi:ribosome biogenesis GTPase Der [Cloacibacillus porcorum]|jgi:GTPase|uniref:GTPase Der n=1 Tax=Cloacibacillus porcorum TaxID=1197717 RepID=A0A1B2I6B9_9BACT|nr:ribosome biogenesis GTPase Der [Cloacibacillus porcorum]ANZ45487.1 ribosome biogenesis GTPase Der [Cloacibacillus porcorum]MCC8185232.1 ribosome biogenesis GTPase Der [Cloacibacillus porcorum]MDD7650167.1 ribosome biogenesis GTPase Der [Cloacibacillus porcorum]MDY4094846.1 ribosome biogenesis GTPase Der [Cloacibacillus porcorum]MDY5388859.1 ribosome biogenesis GTPase Der [Cloacibacillus porcorum]
MAIVAIVGRPNVGKSSIFNRILGKRAAIVDDQPGVTRDRLYGETEWAGKKFYIVDTGGIMSETEHPFMDLIEKQVDLALDESSAIIFVVDGRTGVTPTDEEIAHKLRRSGKPVVVVMNKLDNEKQEDAMLGEAYGLGFDEVVASSAEHNTGFGEMLDFITSKLESEEFDSDDGEIRVTLVGRPNVGKSSLLNAFAGEERSMVSDIAGTTRDVVDSVVEMNGHRFRFLDTAGLRRKSRVNTDLEYYSNVRTYQAIDRCHVALVLLDAQDPVTEQDKRLIGQVLERGKGLILVVNKWDLAPREEKVGDVMTKKLIEELPFAAHAPRVFISALSGRSLGKLPELILKVEENRRRRIATSELNKLVKEVLVFERMPGDGKGHSLKIYYCTQADGAPPAFIFFVNDSELCSKSFKRHLENLLREMADFSGVPIKIFMRNKI